jgi:hypothetical protein
LDQRRGPARQPAGHQRQSGTPSRAVACFGTLVAALQLDCGSKPNMFFARVSACARAQNIDNVSELDITRQPIAPPPPPEMCLNHGKQTTTKCKHNAVCAHCYWARPHRQH